ncbi:MAG: phospho-N-acetylmuramoyl-pentapeptide-transferase [Candidatus Omnitrophica bacterium]|nr:phospho-N-acetylmuramoyl-pentapeptide-transferase [Candidatus Omnitrophota bacterium]
MFYHLLYPLHEFFSGFNVFRYISFRAAGASVTAFLLSIVLGPAIIRLLKQAKITQTKAQETRLGLHPAHAAKAGTPTMGGLFMVIALTISVLLWARLDNSYVWMALLATLSLGVLGFIDDWLKWTRQNEKGLQARVKFIGQIVVGLGIGYFLWRDPDIGFLTLPFFKNFILPMGLFYIPFAALVVTGSSNAVNLTDGLDGLAAGCLAMVAGTYGIMSYLVGHIQLSDYLNVIYVARAAELTVFCSALVGTALGFLWYNCHPAHVFMGDTGALALGGAVGVVAVLIQKEILLLLVAGIFVIEAGSVILQVGSYKLRKKKLFLVSPLHQHLLYKKWEEPQVTVRLWIVGFLLAVLGLMTLKLQ